jgi:hypothetical protein
MQDTDSILLLARATRPGLLTALAVLIGCAVSCRGRLCWHGVLTFCAVLTCAVLCRAVLPSQAIPSGPRRKSLKAWTAPDLTTLSRSIRTSQLTQARKQRQEDRVNQQAEQQELLQETVLKQQQQLDQLVHLLAQSSAEGGLNPSRSISQGLSLNPSAGSVGEQGLGCLASGLLGSAAKLVPLTATTVLPDGLYNWAAYTGGFKAASEALAAAAATAAEAGLDGSSSSSSSSSSSVSHLQQLILQPQQQQQQLRQQQADELPPQLLQLLASTASASGAQTATAVAAATAAAAAASKLPAGSIALLLQEAAANLLAQQQEQQGCCQSQAAANMQAGQNQKQRSSRRSGQNMQTNALGTTTATEAALGGATQQDASSAVPQRALYRSSTSSSTASSTAESATGEQYQPRSKSLAPVSFDLPPMSMSVHLKSFQADGGGVAFDAATAAGTAVPGRVSAVLSSRQYQQQQAPNAGVRLSGAHKLKGRCSFTVDNPLFHLEGCPADQLTTDTVVASAAAAVGGLSAGSSGRSLGSRSSRSAVYLSPAAAETICQAATTAAAAAAAAVRSAVIKLDGEDLLAAGDSHGECMCADCLSPLGALACLAPVANSATGCDLSL